MRILVYIAVWQRPEVTRICFEGVKRLIQDGKKYGLELIPWIVGSEDEMEQLCNDYSFTYVETENHPLGAKLNFGLAAARWDDWDYMMQLGSDNLLRPDFFAYALPMIEKGVKMFGTNRLYMYDAETNRALLFNSETVTIGAGRFIHRSVIEALNWELWPKNRNKVLDLGSEERIYNATQSGQTFGVVPVQMFVPWSALVLDIKDGNGLHPFSDFEGKGIEVSPEEIFIMFPGAAGMRPGYFEWRVTTTTAKILDDDYLMTRKLYPPL